MSNLSSRRPIDAKYQCTAHLRDGSGIRCRKRSIRGGVVCASHGGAAPAVKRKARERLDALAEPAIVELNKILRRKDVADADKLKAIETVLDRIPGLSKRAAIDAKLEVEQVKPSSVYGEIIREAKAKVAAGKNRPLRSGQFCGSCRHTHPVDEGCIFDAEVVDDPPPPKRKRARKPPPAPTGTALVLRGE